MPVEEKEKKQGRKKRGRSAPKPYSNVMMVRIQKDEKGEPEGEIIHLNLQKHVPYQGMAELGFRIDEIAGFLNLPDQGYRSLRGEGKERSRTLQKEFCQIVPTEQWKREDFAGRFPIKGAKETVSVELLGRQYMSLQGRLRCRGTREQYVYFRSALELMHLFAELLQDKESREHPLDSEASDLMEEAEIL